MKKFLLISSLLCISVVKANILDVPAQKSPEDDAAKISEYQDRCEAIKALIVNKEYALDCYTNYNHYGPTSNAVRSTGALKIANYNLLHPGTSKALFKDYTLIAKIMNRYDIVAGLELLATVGRDEQNNRSVLELIQGSADMVTKLRQQKSKLKDSLKIQEMDVKIVKLINDTRTAYDLYRAPGYLRVLTELKKLDPSWALILSPRGDSALAGSVEELSGYFYRSNAATPTVNPHCKEVADTGGGTPYACLITLTEDFMGKDLAKHFARRPFMASFKAKGKTFTLVTSHMVFTYSGDEEAEKDLMQKTFGVDSYKELGGGINSTNFARYAEVKNTLTFMDLYRKKYKDNRIMFMADTNLISNNIYWPEILKAFPGGQLLINEPTTLSPARYMSNGKETNGVANDYDHFILDKTAFFECNDGEVYNYYNENIYKDIESRYVIRKETVGLKKKNFNFNIETYEAEHVLGLDSEDSAIVEDGDIPPVDDPATIKLEYPLTPAGQSKMDKFVSGFDKYLTNLYTVKRNEVVGDEFQVQERLEGLKRRVFLRQLTNPYYYRFMQEVLSDHFPVAITCKQ
ncbi:hypothetical protein SHI21_11840 [Bacteriovorax sp. PP10]|uniref:Uncharacterized protein n=1 Tax=Bacteriovorax antarcticus TaxID=3088717 RepID=A0ABU5VV21_9BACT|nr:hypothetical protein [Bacteriovorax sp. PP10]MEA9356905.1 hypothetical protein [Bacteriovorax sp. PP10]